MPSALIMLVTSLTSKKRLTSHVVKIKKWHISIRPFIYSTIFVSFLHEMNIDRGWLQRRSDIKVSFIPKWNAIQMIWKRISPPRNPSSGWISSKKSKSGFHGFPFHRSIGKSGKRICKTILVNSGLPFANYACAWRTAVLEDSFSNHFSDFPIER